jgi:hypothetical protein
MHLAANYGHAAVVDVFFLTLETIFWKLALVWVGDC